MSDDSTGIYKSRNPFSIIINQLQGLFFKIDKNVVTNQTSLSILGVNIIIILTPTPYHSNKNLELQVKTKLSNYYYLIKLYP